MNTDKQEFKIIETFFSQTLNDPSVILGIGDDAAIVDVPQNEKLVICVDTLIEGVHFPKDVPAEAIGHKALAVNLSDLAAMGAMPRWFTLALTLPNIDEVWLQSFSQGLFKLAQQYNISLVGGDLTRGPLSITIQALGTQKLTTTMRRAGAKPGDKIYLTGNIGLAALGLKCWQKKKKVSDALATKAIKALNYPEPRLTISQIISPFAHAAIDISDGLLADLKHILSASQCGAEIHLENLPLDKDMLQEIGEEQALHLALGGGDDYELCFTAAPEHSVDFPCIGTITETRSLQLLYHHKPFHIEQSGFHHF